MSKKLKITFSHFEILVFFMLSTLPRLSFSFWNGFVCVATIPSFVFFWIIALVTFKRLLIWIIVIFRLFDNCDIIKKLQPWKDCEMKVIRWALVSPHSDFAIIHNNSGHSDLVHLPLTLQRETDTHMLTVTASKTMSNLHHNLLHTKIPLETHTHMLRVTATRTISNQHQHPDTTSKPLITPSSSTSLKSAVTPTIWRCFYLLVLMTSLVFMLMFFLLIHLRRGSVLIELLFTEIWVFLACLWVSPADFKINARSHLDVIISLHSYEAGGQLLSRD